MEENSGIIKYFECACHSYDHPLKLSYFKKRDKELHDYMFLCISSEVYESFWKRIVQAFKYVFRGDSFDFEEFVIVDRKEIDELIEFLDQFDKDIGN